MAVKHLFLAILSTRPMHGYDLKNTFETLVSNQWPLNYGQVYTTLSRLERDGLVEVQEVEQLEKPDKKVYHITHEGKEVLVDWFKSCPKWNMYFDEIAFKFAVFDLIEINMSVEILKEYRIFLLQLIHELTKMKDAMASQDMLQELMFERNILKAEADLKWVDLCQKKLEG